MRIVKWFEKSNLCDNWVNWTMCSSGVPGVTPSSQAIESYHGAFKKFSGVKTDRELFSVVQFETLPALLKHCGLFLVGVVRTVEGAFGNKFPLPHGALLVS